MENIRQIKSLGGAAARRLVAVITVLVAVLSALSVTGGLAAVPEQPLPVGEIRIQILSGGDEALWDSLARDLLPIKRGEPYTPAAVAESITALKDSRLFAAIHVPDPEEGASGMVLTFVLTPFDRIKKIRIRNAFPLYQREILNVMHMEVGGPFDARKLEEQEDRIANLYGRQGFPGAIVRVTAEKDPEDGHVVVDVTITKGPYQKIRQVRFEGNHAVSAARLRLSCRTWRSTLLLGSARRFVSGDMKDDVRDLTAIYRQRGFADVGITAETVETGTDREVDVVFTVSEGPLYEIEFQGNRAMSDRALNRELTLAATGNRNNFALRKSLKNIQKKYEGDGFADAKVLETSPPAPSEGRRPADSARPARQVDIRIEEGPRYKVSALTITGARSISLKAVRENILTPGRGGIFSTNVLEEDAEAVRALYLKEGYAHATVETRVQYRDSEDKKIRWVEAGLIITEGPQVQVDTVSFSGLSALSRETALSLLALTPGRPYTRALAESDRDALHRAVSEAGYPHARISSHTTFSGDGTAAGLAYEVEQGPLVRVGRIFYAGNLRTREATLEREMEIAQGDPFVLSRVVESRRNLLNLNALDSVRIRSVGLKTMEEEVDLIVEVSEKKPYFVELGTGYDSERHLYLTTGAGDRNLTGRNLNLQSGAELSQIGYKLDFSLTDPRFLSSSFVSHTRMFTEEREEFNKDFGIRTYGVSQDFLRLFKDINLTLNLGGVYEFRDQYQTVSRALTEEEASEYRTRHIGVLTPGLTYRTTDSFIRPRKGILATANVDLSKGIDNTLDDFVKFRTDLRYYMPVTGPLTLALRGRYGYIIPYGNSARFPDDQLFFLGGTTTVRGFDENMLRFDADGNSVGGLEMLMASAEARLDMGRNIETTLFYDTGAVKRTQGRSDDESFRDSVGLGLRYQTPVGPIGLLYGWKLDPAQGESRGCFHFSMGYTF